MHERSRTELRPVLLAPGWMAHAEGSCLAEMGLTRVLCSATVEEKLPPFLEHAGKGGWVTAEYGMLPRSTHTRQQRERSRGSANSRALEISRLIGRTLRIAVDLPALGERTITLDCDVLQADGGTRCCAINGAVVALHLALGKLAGEGKLTANPLKTLVAAVSVGLVDGAPRLDLDYALDSRAEVDLNVVMTAGGRLAEVQGTAEHEPFDRSQLNELLDLAGQGIDRLIAIQKEVLGLA